MLRTSVLCCAMAGVLAAAVGCDVLEVRESSLATRRSRP